MNFLILYGTGGVSVSFFFSLRCDSKTYNEKTCIQDAWWYEGAYLGYSDEINVEGGVVIRIYAVYSMLATELL